MRHSHSGTSALQTGRYMTSQLTYPALFSVFTTAASSIKIKVYDSDSVSLLN